jgi:hypothetical protein
VVDYQRYTQNSVNYFRQPNIFDHPLLSVRKNMEPYPLGKDVTGCQKNAENRLSGMIVSPVPDSLIVGNNAATQESLKMQAIG